MNSKSMNRDKFRRLIRDLLEAHEDARMARHRVALRDAIAELTAGRTALERRGVIEMVEHTPASVFQESLVRSLRGKGKRARQ